MFGPLYVFLTDDAEVFREECSYYYPIKNYVNALGGHWGFVECSYDENFPAYCVEYNSTDGRKLKLTVTAIGGKYPPDISHTISS